MKKQLPKIIAIVGQTATGKSDLAVQLALLLRGEVISADSRQVYRGLDKGSGKIQKREMRGVPHHLLDIARPQSIYSVEQFKRDGSRAIDDILSRGKVPIICGGTGFYIDALIYDESFPAVPPDTRLRTRLAQKSTEALMREITRLDKRRARELDPHNKVRIIRAIEIARALGSVPKTKRRTRYDVLSIGLTLPQKELVERIRARLLRRNRGNAIAKEVRTLHTQGVSWKRLHELGLEYRYFALYVRGMISKDEMLETLTHKISQFARRQMTWFKRTPTIEWFSPKDARTIERLAVAFIKK